MGRRKYLNDKFRLFAIIQADDFNQWIACQVKAQTLREAVFVFNKHYGYPTNNGKCVDFVLTGTERDKYLRVVELGGSNLPFTQRLEPNKVYEVEGLYDWES